MASCPNCGSTAQVKLIETNYTEDGWTIELVRIYDCGCGCRFKGSSYYTCQEAYETITPIHQTYARNKPTPLAAAMVKKLIENYEKNS